MNIGQPLQKRETNTSASFSSGKLADTKDYKCLRIFCNIDLF